MLMLSDESKDRHYCSNDMCCMCYSFSWMSAVSKFPCVSNFSTGLHFWLLISILKRQDAGHVLGISCDGSSHFSRWITAHCRAQHAPDIMPTDASQLRLQASMHGLIVTAD